jgi:hypothetical protein
MFFKNNIIETTKQNTMKLQPVTTGGKRKVDNEDFHNLYSSPNNIGLINQGARNGLYMER